MELQLLHPKVLRRSRKQIFQWHSILHLLGAVQRRQVEAKLEVRECGKAMCGRLEGGCGLQDTIAKDLVKRMLFFLVLGGSAPTAGPL